ncbi:MAG: GNAT family N-acetyltransferase [Proteobacteria bacterium]|nr:GNAT family N-acetyltransferase [Pseudomonadota bacterium]
MRPLTGIRDYEDSDRDAVIALFRSFMAELATPAVAPVIGLYMKAAIEQELSRIPEYYLARPRCGFWVIEREGVAGMVGIEPGEDGAAELRRMAVAHQYRNQGLGRALLRHAEAFCLAQGYAAIVLSTSELQQAAMQLYASAGYVLVRSAPAVQPSHKSVGAGLMQHHFRKSLEDAA